MKIGLVIDDSLDPVDGVQQHVLTLGAWLSQQGHEVHYLASETNRTDLPNLHVLGKRLNVKFNGNRLGTPLPASGKEIAALLAEHHFDVLHIQMPYSPLLAGRLIAKAPATTAVVGTFHILPLGRLVAGGARVLGAVQRRQLKRFNHFIAVSEPAAKFAHDAFGIDCQVIGNPVNLAGLLASLPDAGAPDSVAPAQGRVRIVFLGRLVERKGPRELLAAYQQARRQTDVPLELVLAGRGPLLEELQAAAVGDPHVSFPGFIAEDTKASLLAGADIVALPSTGGESFGISVVEALAVANGVVLAGDNPGYRSVMTGLEDQLVQPGDVHGFAQQLLSWIEDARARAEAVARQQEQAAKFDIEVIGARVSDVYREVILRVEK